MCGSESSLPCSVLLVDDDPISMGILQEHIQAPTHRVITTTTASHAKEVLREQPIQVVIADWIMPEMSGLELCRWVRAQDFAHPVHFVMLTVYSERAKLIEAFEAGVDDFLSKPLDPAELLARLRAWTRFIRLQEDLAARHRDAEQLNDELQSTIAALAVANTDLAELAIEDELTKLPNRRAAMRRLNEHWTVAQRYSQPFTCALVDVDHFKEFNDNYGHAAGDELLRHIARALRDNLRTADAAFRIGGDEFLILFPASGLNDAAGCAARIQQAVRSKPIAMPEAVCSCTVSIGFAETEQSMSSPKDLLKATDLALYAAKQAGRNAWRLSPAGTPTSVP